MFVLLIVLFPHSRRSAKVDWVYSSPPQEHAKASKPKQFSSCQVQEKHASAVIKNNTKQSTKQTKNSQTFGSSITLKPSLDLTQICPRIPLVLNFLSQSWTFSAALPSCLLRGLLLQLGTLHTGAWPSVSSPCSHSCHWERGVKMPLCATSRLTASLMFKMEHQILGHFNTSEF